MEMKKEMKTEFPYPYPPYSYPYPYSYPSSNPTDQIPSSSSYNMTTMYEGGGGGGFLDLLGIQDFGSSVFDFLQQSPPPPQPQPTSGLSPSPPLPLPPSSVETSEVLNLPATPNSSSISSSSNEVATAHEVALTTDEQSKVLAADDDEEDKQEKTEKQLKPKKKNQKRQREPRFAFMTKSDVDHLEDGYRWRKYGQKAVKNSPFPRSYYRCTNTTCGVKKRVERSCEDPSTVVTTYEGQHTHPSPIVPRGSSGGFPRESAIAQYGVGTSAYTMSTQLARTHYQQQLQPQQEQALFQSLPSSMTFNSPGFTSRAAMLRDHGLLQDLVPSDMRKEDQ